MCTSSLSTLDNYLALSDSMPEYYSVNSALNFNKNDLDFFVVASNRCALRESKFHTLQRF